MTRRRHLQSVLHNYLSSLASRYSDYEGYWMLGFLAAEPQPLNIGLLVPPSEDVTSPSGAFECRAVTLFRDQFNKAGLALDAVAEADLTVSKSAFTSAAWLNGRARPARELTLRVRVVTDLGREYASEQIHPAAPHDPSCELRSSRAEVASGLPGI